jgi:hypothetical protein
MNKKFKFYILVLGGLIPLILLDGQACSQFSALEPKGGASFSSFDDPTLSKICGAGYSPGHVSLHRLNNEEYNNTVRDLLYTTSRPGDQFPPSGSGASGFSNDSERLTVFDVIVLDYAAAADTLAAEVIASKNNPGGAYSRIAPCAAAAPNANCAKTSIENLATRAYRRPVTAEESGRLLNIFSQAGDFDTGLSTAISAILVSPNFTFISVTSGDSTNPNAAFALNNFELASRLSYFLWQSMPDDRLFQLATSGALGNPDILKTEITRMLQDTRASSMIATLQNEWLGEAILNDPYAGLDDTLRMSMVKETNQFLSSIVKQDLSAASIVNAKYTYVNKQLADLYGVPFTGSNPAAFVKTDLTGAARAGVIGQAAFLTASAGAVSATHPVKRGKAVLTRMMCQTVLPPPPGIPTIPDVGVSGLSPRATLEQHAKSASCNGCHQTMDVLGLGLESFDPFGKFRTSYANTSVNVDPAGVIPGGAAFSTSGDLLTDLGSSPVVQACIAKQVMSLAITRALVSSDDSCVSKTIGATKTATKFSDLIWGIVSSRQFSMQTGEAP